MWMCFRFKDNGFLVSSVERNMSEVAVNCLNGAYV